MSSLSFNSTTMLALICIVGAVYLLNNQQVASKAVTDDRASGNGDELNLFPNYSPDCKSDEQPAFGLTPLDEPTCKNRRPAPTKMFTVMDYVPCFCKKGLLRNTDTGKCVPESECN